MCKPKISCDKLLALDFVFLRELKEDVKSLVYQLSKNYEIEIEQHPSENFYRLAKGTTSPDGIHLDLDTHIEWVTLMVDVARSYNCVFSTWSIEAP